MDTSTPARRQGRRSARTFWKQRDLFLKLLLPRHGRGRPADRADLWGETCGTDGYLYQCNASVFSSDGTTCSGSVCQCSGDSVSGPVVVNCASSTCGTDNNLYTCGSSGWSSAGQTCTINPPPVCACSGTDVNDQPVTVDCGQSACGSDGNLYNCVASNWSYAGTTCQ